MRYAAPTGLPITLQFGVPVSTIESHSLSLPGQPVEHCVFDARTYFNRDDFQRQWVRWIADPMGLIVLVPRRQLSWGST
jgi:hypothetical protein